MSAGGVRAIHRFVEECRKKGYRSDEPLFKADFNGRLWSVNFSIGPISGRAKKENLEDAILCAIEEAKRNECYPNQPVTQ